MTTLEPGAETVARSSDPSPPCGSPSPDFEELALPLFDSVYRFARWLAANEADADDIVQEAYLRAFRSFATFEPGSNFRAWIFRIVKNAFLTSRTAAHQRHSALSNSDELLANLPSHWPDPAAALMHRARMDAVLTAMEQLPIPFREVLVLCDLEEASYRETAQALSIPIGTVMSRLSRARKVVRESIHPRYGIGRRQFASAASTSAAT